MMIRGRCAVSIAKVECKYVIAKWKLFASERLGPQGRGHSVVHRRPGEQQSSFGAGMEVPRQAGTVSRQYEQSSAGSHARVQVSRCMDSLNDSFSQSRMPYGAYVDQIETRRTQFFKQNTYFFYCCSLSPLIKVKDSHCGYCYMKHLRWLDLINRWLIGKFVISDQKKNPTLTSWTKCRRRGYQFGESAKALPRAAPRRKRPALMACCRRCCAIVDWSSRKSIRVPRKRSRTHLEWSRRTVRHVKRATDSLRVKW